MEDEEDVKMIPIREFEESNNSICVFCRSKKIRIEDFDFIDTKEGPWALYYCQYCNKDFIVYYGVNCISK